MSTEYIGLVSSVTWVSTEYIGLVSFVTWVSTEYMGLVSMKNLTWVKEYLGVPWKG